MPKGPHSRSSMLICATCRQATRAAFGRKDSAKRAWQPNAGLEESARKLLILLVEREGLEPSTPAL